MTATVRLRRESRHDPLTGLGNRTALEECLAGCLHDDPAGTLVVFIDLDGFKDVNDVHGHEAGDCVLVEVAQRLQSVVRPGDVVGRYGGDEFVVVCRDAQGPDIAAGLAARLTAALTGPIPFAGGSWEPAASIGSANPVGGESLASVLRRADQAMFERKRRSRIG